MSRLFTGERVILYHGAFGDGDELVYQIRYTDNNGKKRLKVVRSDKEPIAWAKRFPEQICSTHPESGFF